MSPSEVDTMQFLQVQEIINASCFLDNFGERNSATKIYEKYGAKIKILCDKYRALKYTEHLDEVLDTFFRSLQTFSLIFLSKMQIFFQSPVILDESAKYLLLSVR